MSPRPDESGAPLLTADEAADALRGVSFAFGLRAQGHLPTIERMLAEGASWPDIGRAIGWCPDTARQWYERETAPPPLDFPTAWRLQKAGLAHTDARCSAVQTNGAVLCDCGAVEAAWAAESGGAS